VNDFISTKSDYLHSGWNEFLLEIAQKEHDISTVKKVSFDFIKNHFNEKYFRIYKSTFTPKEWTVEFENIIRLYEKQDRYPSYSVADVLVSEKAVERLMNYVEKYLSTELIDRYYTSFAMSFPEKPLDLFQRAIDQYAEKNVGRSHYERIAQLMKNMKQIKDGNQVVANMIIKYKIRYKARRAMIEVLSRVM
jgi:hypothetical protein